MGSERKSGYVIEFDYNLAYVQYEDGRDTLQYIGNLDVVNDSFSRFVDTSEMREGISGTYIAPYYRRRLGEKCELHLTLGLPSVGVGLKYCLESYTPGRSVVARVAHAIYLQGAGAATITGVGTLCIAPWLRGDLVK